MPASSMAGVAASASVELGVSTSMPFVAVAGGMKGSIGEGDGKMVASMVGLGGLSPTFDVGLVSSSITANQFNRNVHIIVCFFFFVSLDTRPVATTSLSAISTG